MKLGVLALLLGAIYAIARWCRQTVFLRRSGRRVVAVVETTMLTPHVSLHLLRAGARFFLVSAGSSGARTLAQWTSGDEASDVEVAELREFVPGGFD